MTQYDSADQFHPQGGDRIRPSAATAGKNRALLILVAALAAIVLVILVVRVSAMNVIFPDRPEARLDQTLDQLRLKGSVDAAEEQTAMQDFERVPLSEVPLLIRARQAITRGDGASADRLLAAAVRRNPRSRYGLLLQLDRDVRAGRNREAAANMATLARLFSDVGDFLVAELARMAAVPETRAAVIRVMESDPQMRKSVLEQMALRGADPEVIISLAGPLQSGPRTEPPRWLGLMLDNLVERGEAATARSIWLRLSGANAASGSGPVYDPGFSGLPGPPPFNWKYEMSADGFAERGTNELQVEYYGRDQARLASQLILLAPGRYRISFEAEGQAEGDAGRLAWTVTCQPGTTQLVEVPITGVDFTPKSFAAEFAVPAEGCRGQWLRLVGSSAEFPKDQRVTIRRLQISEAGQR